MCCMLDVLQNWDLCDFFIIVVGFNNELLLQSLQTIPTKDRIEGLLAFKEKRPPRYKGE